MSEEHLTDEERQMLRDICMHAILSETLLPRDREAWRALLRKLSGVDKVVVVRNG